MIERELTPQVIDDILTLGPIDDLRVLPIALSMDPPQGVDVERICRDLAFHKDPWVRGNALTAFGHLARVLRKLDKQGRIKQILEAALSDEEAIVCSRAGDAISDIETFLGWQFQKKDPEPQPRVPRTIFTRACYRIYLLIDEESHILVERAIPSSTDFAPDPRGLSSGHEWRLPGFSLTDPLSQSAQSLEEHWAMRYPKVWANESNRFDEVAVVRTTLSGEEQIHRWHDWIELRCRACFLMERTDNPYTPADGVEHRWLTTREFMSGEPVGAHDRYVVALFNNYALQEMGAGSAFI
ncbi:hypothetical protein [Tsuneonella suprasediminis]|uniref:hypothetical protein n=1 Tax=Tsuneonella suprasediminis TaxID=2306996 RepID=UPI002F927DF8